ncbi:nuclear protein, partial [Helicostylum pulchrum]
MSSTRDLDNKRKRLTQACELCRRKKIRCDGGKPTCGNCTRLNSECTYSTNSKKRGPRQGYIEILEQRLAKME